MQDTTAVTFRACQAGQPSGPFNNNKISYLFRFLAHKMLIGWQRLCFQASVRGGCHSTNRCKGATLCVKHFLNFTKLLNMCFKWL